MEEEDFDKEVDVEEEEEEEEEKVEVTIPVLKDNSIKIFQDSDWENISNSPSSSPTPIRSNIHNNNNNNTNNKNTSSHHVNPYQQKNSMGATRAAPRGFGTRAPQAVKGEEVFRKSSIYVCIDQTAFMNQLEKEVQMEIKRQTIIQEKPTDTSFLSVSLEDTEDEKKHENSKHKRGRYGAPPPARKILQSLSISNLSNAPQVYQELINTEKSYIKDLSLICDVFLQPVRDLGILKTFEIVTLFSNIEELIGVNQALLNDLEAAGVEGVGEVFQKHAEKFKIYAAYCSNQPNIRERIHEFKAEYPDFARLLKSAFRNPICRKQDLESFLISPLQRLCKYPLLLKELMKFTHKVCFSSLKRGTIRMMISNLHLVVIMQS